MTFDGNLAWKQGAATVRANRDLVLALAGVFLFLPSFALIMLIKQPQMAAGATPEAMVAQLEPFIAAILPWALLGWVVQSLGELALVELFGQGARSTVGEALRRALGAFLTYLVTRVMISFMLGSLLLLVAALGSLVSPLLGLILAIFAVCQVYARFLVSAAVIVAERQRNPFLALTGSAMLTRGNGFRIGNFFFLLVSAFVVVFMVTTIVVGIVAALTVGQGRAGEIVTGFFSSAVTAAALAYFMAIVVASYRQLTGTPAVAPSE